VAPAASATSAYDDRRGREYLNVPARWVADAVRQRKVRCTRIGKHVRFRVEHLDELVAPANSP